MTSYLTYRSECEVGDIRNFIPLGTVSMLYKAFSSLPNRCVAKPNEHDCLWKTDTKSSGTTSLLVSEMAITRYLFVRS